jgi:diguanylate cyclase (GGDEF)-like protein
VDVLLNTSKLTNELGEVSYMTVGVDVTEQNEMLKSIDRMTYVDFLTSIGNRRLLELEAKEHIEEGTSFTLVFFDIDGFKAINDHFGHSVGDQLLQHVAKRLTDFIGDQDIASRIGGDEFGLLLQDRGSRQVGEERVQALKEALAAPFELEGEERTMGYRFGVTGYPADGSSAIVLFKNADLAMNEAKKRQEETCIIYSETLFTQEAKRLRILNDMDRALREDHFSIVLQPIYNLRTGLASGAEILLRWTHEDLGVISPAEFIPIAEETALIVEIDRWVIDRALGAIGPLQQKYGPHFSLSLNLSANTLISEEVVSMVSDLLDKHGVPASSIILEITETAVIADVDRAVAQVEKLRNLGLCIALDDFGTGYSSLSYLKMLPIDHVKLDKSYVGKISVTLMDEKIISSLVALSQDIGYQVVAEGIETRDQLDFLVDLGCDFGQGYHLARPMALDQLMALERQSIFES